MARSCVLFVLIWLAAPQLTTSYVIDEVHPDDQGADFVKEVKDNVDAGDEPNTQGDQEMLESVLKFINEKGIQTECTEEAVKKTGHVLKERKEKDKTILRNNYQILQHGEESIASNKEWLEAIKSGICSGCVVKKICDHPPDYLSKYVSLLSKMLTGVFASSYSNFEIQLSEMPLPKGPS